MSLAVPSLVSSVAVRATSKNNALFVHNRDYKKKNKYVV